VRKYEYVFIPALLLLVVSSFLLPHSVSAFPLTVSPTRDIRTPGFTPTAGGGVESFYSLSNTSNNECVPLSSVSGWGTVTPDALWMLTCGSCVPTTTPAYDDYIFPTPLPTNLSIEDVAPCLTAQAGVNSEQCYSFPTSAVTPTPFQTLTPVATSTPYYSSSAFLSCPTGSNVMIGSVCTQIDDYSIEFTGVSNGENVMSWNFGVSAASDIFVKVTTGVNDLVYWHFAEGATTKQILAGYQSAGVDYPLSSVSSSHGTYSSNVGYELVTPGDVYYDFSVPYSADIHRFYYYVAPDSEQDRKFYFNSSVITASGLPVSGSGSVLISTNPLLTPTPTPTPSGGDNYCASVNGFGDLENQDVSFVGDPSDPVCIIIPSFSTDVIMDFFYFISTFIPIGFPGIVQIIEVGMEYFNVVTPSFPLCFVEYEILVVDFFGVLFSLIWFVNIGIGMYIINHFTSR
jgi:hypothetical protein